MKTISYLLVLLILGALYGCAKDKTDQIFNPDLIAKAVETHSGFNIMNVSTEDKSLVLTSSSGKIFLTSNKVLLSNQIVDLTTAAMSVRQCSQIVKIVLGSENEDIAKADRSIQAFVETTESQSVYLKGAEFKIGYIEEMSVVACKLEIS